MSFRTEPRSETLACHFWYQQRIWLQKRGAPTDELTNSYCEAVESQTHKNEKGQYIFSEPLGKTNMSISQQPTSVSK